MSGRDSHLGFLLFGRVLRLDLALWILTSAGDRFFLSEAMAAMGPGNRSSVANELERLEAAGLVREEEGAAAGRRRYFTRTDAVAWSVFRAAAALPSLIVEGEDYAE